MSVQIRLFGTPQVENEGVWLEPRLNKPFQLLCYLAHTHGWVGRDRLAFLFWPDSSDPAAKANLRQLVRRAKGLAFAGELEIDGDRLRWLRSTDIGAFRQALAERRWRDAVVHYQGPLLADLVVDDSSAFEAWLELEREGLARAWREAAMERISELETEGDHGGAVTLLRRLLDVDLAAEDVVQRYLKAAYLDGRREEALRAYEAFAKQLADELDLEPLEATQALAASIRAAEPLATPPSTLAPERPRIPVQVLRPPQLIGRDEHLVALETATEKTVMIAGEAGVGKSRLAAEVAPRALLIRCQEGMQNVPYYPLTVALRQHLDTAAGSLELGPYRNDLARLVPEVAPEARPDPADPITAQVRLLEALSRFVEAAVPADRFQLLIDDLQWADEATIAFLTHLVAQGRIRVIGTYRHHETTPALRRSLDGLKRQGLLLERRLEPLSAADITDLMASLIEQAEGPPVFSRWLFERSGGNPMFMLETLKSLFESEVLSAEEAGWRTTIDEVTRDYSELQVPEAVSQVVERRTARLTESALRVVKAAAVIGPQLDPRLLGQVAGLSELAVLEALTEAEQRGLVLDDHFVHDLVRQSVYSSLGGSQRRLLHARVAEQLPDGTDPSIRGEHWLAAGVFGAAVSAWLEAADSLRSRGLFDAALLLLARGLSHTDELRLRQRLEVKVADTFQQAGRNTEALERIATLLPNYDDPQLQAALFNSRALVELREGHLEAAAVSVEACLEVMGQVDDPRLEMSITLTRAILLFGQGDYRATIALLEPVAAGLRKTAASDNLVTVLTSLAAAYDMHGDQQRALPLHREALRLAKTLGFRYFQVDAALNLLYCLMDLDQAEEGLREGEAALELGHFENSPTLRANLATAYFDLQRFEEALGHYRLVIEESEHGFVLAITWARMAETFFQLARNDAIEDAIDRAIQEALDTDLALARARVLTTTLKLGNPQQIERTQGWTEALDLAALPDYIREELEGALAQAAAENR